MSIPNPTAAAEPTERPLAGLRVAVTATRRADDQIAALERAGAEAFHAPTMRIVPVEDDTALIEETHALLEAAPPTFFVTTGQGINSWLDILEDPLKQQVLDYLSTTQIICRGSKGRGTVRKWGLPDAPSSEKETSTSMVELALELGIADGPVGLQRHGYVPDKALAPLGDRELYVVAPYRWELAEDLAPVHTPSRLRTRGCARFTPSAKGSAQWSSSWERSSGLASAESRKRAFVARSHDRSEGVAEMIEDHPARVPGALARPIEQQAGGGK